MTTKTAQNLTTGTMIEIDGSKWAVLVFVDAAYNLARGYHAVEKHAAINGVDLLYVQKPKGQRVFCATVCRETGAISTPTFSH